MSSLPHAIHSRSIASFVFALSALLGTVGVVYFSRIVVPPPDPPSEGARRGFAELFWPRAAGREPAKARKPRVTQSKNENALVFPVMSHLPS